MKPAGRRSKAYYDCIKHLRRVKSILKTGTMLAYTVFLLSKAQRIDPIIRLYKEALNVSLTRKIST